jgi:hypothetical protein
VSLGIKPRIEHLKVGESSIIGPYLESKSCATTICRVRESNPEMFFSQRKMLLVDPSTCETFPVYLVTRIERHEVTDTQ